MRRIIAWQYDSKRLKKAKKGELNMEDWSVPIYADGPWWAWLGYRLMIQIYAFFYHLTSYFEDFLCDHEKFTTTGSTDTGIVESKCNYCGRII